MRKRKRFSGVNESDLESDCWWLRLVGANVKELRSHDLEGLLSRRRQLLLLLLLLIILFIFPCSPLVSRCFGIVCSYMCVVYTGDSSLLLSFFFSVFAVFSCSFRVSALFPRLYLAWPRGCL